MNNARKYKKLGMKTSHRLAVLRNMSVSLLLSGKIVTTLAKARALRVFFEREIVTPTKKQKDPLLAIRRIFPLLGRNRIAFDILLEKCVAFKDRNGGYTRIIKLPVRKSDSAEVAILQIVE